MLVANKKIIIIIFNLVDVQMKINKLYLFNYFYESAIYLNPLNLILQNQKNVKIHFIVRNL